MTFRRLEARSVPITANQVKKRQFLCCLRHEHPFTHLQVMYERNVLAKLTLDAAMK